MSDSFEEAYDSVDNDTVDVGIRAAEIKLDRFFARLDVVRRLDRGVVAVPPDFETEVKSYLALMVREMTNNPDEINLGTSLLMAATAMAKCRRLRDGQK